MDKSQGATLCPEGEDLVFLWQNMPNRGDAHWALYRDLY